MRPACDLEKVGIKSPIHIMVEHQYVFAGIKLARMV